MSKPKIRASSIEKIVDCSGYATVGNNQNTDTKYTRSGTLAHWWLETWINNNLSTMVSDAGFITKAKEMENETNDEEVFSEEIELIRSNCKDFAEFFEREYGEYFSTVKTWNVHTEQGLSIELEKVIITGTADLIIVHDNSVSVIDWKYYSDPSYLSPVKDNLQLQAYLLMAMQLFGKSRGRATIALIKQQEMWTHKFSALEMMMSKAKIEKATEAAASPTFTFGPGCSNCLKRAHCPEFKMQSFFLTHDIEPWDETEPGTEEEARKLALSISGLATRLETVKAYLKKYVKAFGPIDHNEREYRFADKKQNQIVDSIKAFDMLKRFIGDDAFNAIRLTPNVISKVIKSSGKDPKLFIAKLKEERVMRQVKYSYLAWRKKK